MEVIGQGDIDCVDSLCQALLELVVGVQVVDAVLPAELPELCRIVGYKSTQRRVLSILECRKHGYLRYMAESYNRVLDFR